LSVYQTGTAAETSQTLALQSVVMSAVVSLGLRSSNGVTIISRPVGRQSGH